MVWALAALLSAGLYAGAEHTPQAWWLFLKEPPGASFRSAVEAVGASIRTESRWLRAVSVSANERQREKLARLPGVLRTMRVASYSRVVQFPADPSGLPTRHAQPDLMNAEALTEAGLTGEGVRVGILDAGFRLTHPAFERLRVGAVLDVVHQDENVDDEPGQDDPGEAAHGTAMLSIVAELAPNAEYYLAKTEDIKRNGRHFEEHIEEDYWVEGLEWCVENGCAVVNSSLNYALDYAFAEMDGQTSPASLAAVEAMRRGAVIVNAAGNVGGDNLFGRIAPPADSVGVFTVGAALSNGEPAAFSSRGPTADGRLKPDALALGVDVSAAALDGEGFRLARGTSAASALAAGAAALLVEAFPSASPAEMMNALRLTASSADAPNNRRGYGVLNAAGAYEHLRRGSNPAHVDAPRRPAAIFLADLKRGRL